MQASTTTMSASTATSFFTGASATVFSTSATSSTSATLLHSDYSATFSTTTVNVSTGSSEDYSFLVAGDEHVTSNSDAIMIIALIMGLCCLARLAAACGILRSYRMKACHRQACWTFDDQGCEVSSDSASHLPDRTHPHDGNIKEHGIIVIDCEHVLDACGTQEGLYQQRKLGVEPVPRCRGESSPSDYKHIVTPSTVYGFTDCGAVETCSSDSSPTRHSTEASSSTDEMPSWDLSLGSVHSESQLLKWPHAQRCDSMDTASDWMEQLTTPKDEFIAPEDKVLPELSPGVLSHELQSLGQFDPLENSSANAYYSQPNFAKPNSCFLQSGSVEFPSQSSSSGVGPPLVSSSQQSHLAVSLVSMDTSQLQHTTLPMDELEGELPMGELPSIQPFL